MTETVDPLDEAIRYNKNVGNRNYGEVIENIRDRLQVLEGARRPFRGVAWLIECSFGDSPVSYYCGPGDWCSNPSHARKFSSREDAEKVSADMKTIGNRRVCDHSWE